MFEEVFNGGVVELVRGDKLQKANVKELVTGDFAGLDHGRLAEEVALEIGVAKTAGFGEFLFGFDFFGEESDARVAVFIHDATAAVNVEELEIDLEIFGAFDQRSEIGAVNEIVEGQGVAGVAEFATDFDNFAGR